MLCVDAFVVITVGCAYVYCTDSLRGHALAVNFSITCQHYAAMGSHILDLLYHWAI